MIFGAVSTGPPALTTCGSAGWAAVTNGASASSTAASVGSDVVCLGRGASLDELHDATTHVAHAASAAITIARSLIQRPYFALK
jgi:hypothetical protein